MSEIEEKINHVTTSINDIQEQIHLTLSDMYDEFYEHTIEDLDKKISYMDELVKNLKKEEFNLKTLKKKSKPIQAYTITLHYEGQSMASPSEYKEYLYISANPTQDLEEVLFNEIEETWEELGENYSIRTIITSNDFIQKLEDKNIYYINDNYIDLKEKSVYGNIIYENYKK